MAENMRQKMSFKIAIRKNGTGEVRVYQFPEGIEWDDASLFWLSRFEGNFGCDCNRELEFLRAGGADPEWNDTECGHERFDILYAELADGTRIEVDGRASNGKTRDEGAFDDCTPET